LHSLVSAVEAPTSDAEVFKYIFDFIQKEGALENITQRSANFFHGVNQNSSYEKAKLKRAAVLSVLKLVRFSHYENMLSPEQFQTLALVSSQLDKLKQRKQEAEKADDAEESKEEKKKEKSETVEEIDLDMRKKVVKNLAAGLASLQLPLRYLALLSLFSKDPHKDTATEVRQSNDCAI
jgi:hypothetical protein